MSATTSPGHQPKDRAHHRKLGTNSPPSATLAGVSQLMSGTKVTDGCAVGSHKRIVCFLYPTNQRLCPVLSVRPPNAACAAVYVPVLFFEAAAGRRQIRRVHQRHCVRLHPLATQQALQQMLIDPAQSAHADLLSKLVQHSHPKPRSAQPAETTPSGLFGQLGHQQIK
jgi:hypothetical protein